MRNFSFPFLGTHVANIALNKNIALHFLLSNPQETHGFTEYSGESYINDKLHVALWMILQFVKFTDEKPEAPWVELSEWQVPKGSMAGAETIHEFDEILNTIRHESLSFDLWDINDTEAQTFLKKMIVQIEECIWYTNQRLAAIQVCWEISPSGFNNPDAIMNRGVKLAEKLSSNPITMMMGYLQVKNEINSKRILATELLRIVLGFLVDKAVKEGYTKPVAELV